MHYKLSGRPTSRVEPTDERLLGNLASIRSSRTIYRLPKSHYFSKVALDRIVGNPTNPTPDGAATNPQVRRQYITQRWVDENGVTPGCPRSEGRGTMSHSETCGKRFDAIEKKKLDKQMEEAVRNAEPPPEIAAQMEMEEVEQPHEQPSIGGPRAFLHQRPQVRRRHRCQVPHFSRGADGGPAARDPLEGSDESSRKRVRSLAGLLLFNENDTSDWKHSIREAHVSELSNEQHTLERIIDHMQLPDTNIPGVW